MLDVKLCKTSRTNMVTLNGTREVLLRVDEILKHKIRHLVTFGSGQSTPITMQGPPQLCLRCRIVGHVRRDSGQMRTFARVVGQQDENKQRADRSSHVRPAGKASHEPSTATNPGSSAHWMSVPRARGADGSMGAMPAPDDHESQVECDDTDMEELGSSKRERESSDDDFVSPNKTAKQRPLPDGSLPLRDFFRPILTVSDLMADRDSLELEKK